MEIGHLSGKFRFDQRPALHMRQRAAVELRNQVFKGERFKIRNRSGRFADPPGQRGGRKHLSADRHRRFRAGEDHRQFRFAPGERSVKGIEKPRFGSRVLRRQLPRHQQQVRRFEAGEPVGGAQQQKLHPVPRPVAGIGDQADLHFTASSFQLRIGQCCRSARTRSDAEGLTVYGNPHASRMYRSLMLSP